MTSNAGTFRLTTTHPRTPLLYLCLACLPGITGKAVQIPVPAAVSSLPE